MNEKVTLNSVSTEEWTTLPILCFWSSLIQFWPSSAKGFGRSEHLEGFLRSTGNMSTLFTPLPGYFWVHTGELATD